MASKNPATIEDVIEALGGLKGVSEITGSSQSAVWNWRKRQAFPSSAHLLMTAALKKRGLTASAALWGMREMAS